MASLSLGWWLRTWRKINPDLVARDTERKAYTVRYEAVNAMLLNEFLKEHRKAEERDRKVQEQQKEIDALKAQLKEQMTLIQQVNDKLEMNKPASQVVANTP
jgi:predicted RNase H-like nuclease (RuvC/YqgF family)